MVKTLLEETSLSMMEQCVKNYWLEEFYYWTQEQGGYTADMMGEILKTKADTMAHQRDSEQLQHHLQRRRPSLPLPRR